MKIAMIGTGYVGLVTGTCLADSGNTVTCVDIDPKKVERLRNGEMPIYEPGLSELVIRNSKAHRLHFTTVVADAVKEADAVFLAVGTPPDATGAADMKYVWAAVEGIAPHLQPETLVITKSTVPVGTGTTIAGMLKKLTGRDCHVASNPEFLKEGAAINDFQYPDRIVIGINSAHAEAVLRELYNPYLRTDKPLLVMSRESAELTKYVANALLSTKISFINEMANLCERLDGDINDVRRGIGHDRRIGFQFLFPGVGYGGSCFPKDVRALASMAEKVGVEPRLLRAVDAVNDNQKNVLIEKIQSHYGEEIAGKTVAIWGLAFKPRTDDIREAPALVLIDFLLSKRCELQVHDPEAMPNVKEKYGNKLIYARTPEEAVVGADLLAINTEWGEFRNPDFDEMKKQMSGHVIFDGRNLYEPDTISEYGFVYHSIGRKTALPKTAGSSPK